MSWLNIVKKAVDVGAAVLPIISEATDGSSSSLADEAENGYVCGTVDFYPDSRGRIFAGNIGDTDVGLSFSQTNSEEQASVSSSIYLAIVPDEYTEVTDYLTDTFAQGDITIGRTEVTEEDNNADVSGSSTMLSASISFLALATAAKILGNFSVGVYAKNNGYELRFTNDEPMDSWTLRGNVTTASGGTVNLESVLTSSKSSDVYTSKVELPDGVSADPMVQNLGVNVEMPEEDFATLTVASRSQVKSGFQAFKEMDRKRRRARILERK